MNLESNAIFNARRNGMLCAIVVLVSVLSAHPYAEMGFQDDWSYVRTALEYARTGHFIYNGWATAMLGWLIPWGALFIKIFGFSFTAVRMSVLPIAMATVYLLHACMLRCGVGARNSILGTLTFGLSSVFLPLAASFMTDVPGMFVILLCLYCCLRALKSQTDEAIVLWLCCAALTNVVGGTVRQIAWLGALVMVPSTAWLLRDRRVVVITAFALWVGSILSIVLCLHWWSVQMYSVPEKIIRGRVGWFLIHPLVGALVKMFLCLSLLVYPVLTAWLTEASRLSRVAIGWLGALLVGMVASLWLMPPSTRDFWMAPWLTHILNSVTYGRAEFPSATVIPVLPIIRVAISATVVGTLLVYVATLGPTRRSSRPQATTNSTLTWYEMLWIFVPFASAYLSLLIPRALFEFVYDRYLLGLMPFVLIALLRFHQQRFRTEMPGFTFGVLAIFSIFTIAGTHDWFAWSRARLASIQMLHANSVPDTLIQAGFEYDGWTQIDASGYVNERRIETPHGVFNEDAWFRRGPSACRYFFTTYTPAIQPKYVLVASPLSCFAKTDYPIVRYRAWLPPFRRSVYIQEDPELPSVR